MTKQPIIIDCDPGQDDAVMLLLALASRDELEILGITTNAGNVPLALTQRNARLICELAGVTDVAVYAGDDHPMIRPLLTAENVHGKTGIDGVNIYEPALPLQEEHAVDYIVRTLLHADDNSITLVPTGPLSNIGRAILKQPEILAKIKEIVLMGGANREGGNTTPSAEFNIYVDPHAADVVMNCGRPITVLSLDISHKTITTRKRLARFNDLDSKVAKATFAMLDFFNRHDSDKYGTEGAPLHDPGTIAYLLKPDLFKGKLCNVTIETGSELTMGHTAVDFWHVTDRHKNVNWLYEVDADGYYDLIIERLARYE